jgi:O-antigen/teichoic acid export membrane protein
VSVTRRIFAGTGLITVANGAVRLFALLAAPILTSLLGPSPYAVATLVATLAALLVTLSMLGVDMAYARYYFGGSVASAEVERLCWRFTVGTALVMGLLGGTAWGTVLARQLEIPGEYALIVGLTIVLTPIATMAQTRARLRGRYRRLAVAIGAAGAATTLGSIALALWWRADAWALLVGGALGLLAGSFVAGVPDPRSLLQRATMSRAEAWKILRLGLPGVATAAMYWVLSSADRWIIAYHLDQEVLGVYSFAVTLGMLGMMLNSSVTLVWFPEAARAYEADRQGAPEQLGRLWARLVAMLAVVWLAVASAGGDVLRLVADPQFHGGSIYIPWVAMGIFFYGVSSLANTGLILAGDLKPAAGWWVTGAAVSVGINLIAVPRWGALAAAVTVSIGFACIATGVMVSAERRLPLRVPWATLLGSISVIVAAGLVMIPRWSASPLLSLLLKFPVGALVGALAVWIVAPDWVTRAAAVAPWRRDG